jgi:hypothetical protein
MQWGSILVMRMIGTRRWKWRTVVPAALLTLCLPMCVLLTAADEKNPPSSNSSPPKTKTQSSLSDGKLSELPVFLGNRDVRVQLIAGKTTEATLRLQPLGTETLGEWDKLAGVVFGCSTREGRRLCALPSVTKKMNEFAERFREAKNQHDPQLLSEAYNTVADAFEGVADREEAAKWRKKAADQAEKAKAEKKHKTKTP